MHIGLSGSFHRVAEKVNVTTILATNKNLLEEVRNNNFIIDLYERVKTLNFYIPSLAARDSSDFELLVKHFVKKLAKACEKNQLETIAVSAEALKNLTSYKWPGNIRELEGVITKIIVERAHDDTSDISEQEVIAAIGQDLSSKQLIEAKKNVQPAPGKKLMPSIEEIRKLLLKFGGSKTKVAKHIGVTRDHLYHHLKKIGFTSK